MRQRIGVYICHCGGNISDYVDVEELSKMFHQEDGVVVSKDVMFACADSNQKAMVEDIQKHNLDAIVVASCSPKLHLHTFRGVASRAGLNPNNYVQVNIREQCSWPHSDRPREATVKAAGLIRAGINRVAHSEALDNIEIEVKKSVLVIGAGIAGMKAAIDLARSGNEVFLIEKDYFVGGRITQKEKLFTSGQSGKEIVKKLYEEIKTYKNITVFTGATIEKVTGSLGSFNVEIKVKPRYINGKIDKQTVKRVMDECNVLVDDEFSFGLAKRKAIYKNYPEALPDVPVVDLEALKEHSDFIEKHKAVINVNEKEETLALLAGSVLVTTGFDNYEPKEGEYGYKNIPNVITLPQLNRLMELSPEKLVYNGKEIKSVAFIYCVGSRQTKGENKYCSRQCCTSTIYTALQLKEKYGKIQNYHLYRDIRTYGKQEILYDKASKQGDLFFKYEEKELPTVEMSGKSISLKVKDYLTAKKEMEIEPDLVVLVTGMVARADAPHISEMFKIPIGSDKFFNEIHPKLKPVETVIKGVYIGGTCQGPKNVSESVQSSLAGASKITALLKSGTVMGDPVIARIDADACTWCGKCAEVCDYTAIKEIVTEAGKHIAGVNKGVCTGCGICAPVCPVNAIEIAKYTDLEIESMIDGFAADVVIKEKEATESTEKADETQVAAMKEYPQIWKNILETIGTEKKTIPEVVDILKIAPEMVTYHMMTMNKYGVVTPAGTNEKEEYYYYKIK
ncbi:CoB--CoM heterodisulfide reductase 1 iron-sulfur subunit A [uncultured Paludibacter sp.]|uniref:CoB--CoM heterodisulfide reductase 1 iron-sulfur subunit A n=1 Tax=uncultured Paludibacter sp. TaxID=497635 RepID=A0A653AL07_9BACT|nr:CoB--CoM heterodisulfide reductase 1 iron-sulfur subunit A [uncultured Paludibacter sp.]